MDALDEHVAARHDETTRILQHRRVVLSRVPRQVWLDSFQQPELAETFVECIVAPAFAAAPAWADLP